MKCRECGWLLYGSTLELKGADRKSHVLVYGSEAWCQKVRHDFYK